VSNANPLQAMPLLSLLANFLLIYCKRNFRHKKSRRKGGFFVFGVLPSKQGSHSNPEYSKAQAILWKTPRLSN
jgi:hypothetical protein